MKAAFGTGKLKNKTKKRFLTLGIFDGVHRGHIGLIKETVRQAYNFKGISIVLTFYPHPYHILKPKRYLPLLISLEHRISIIRSLGVDVCLIQNFTDKFSNISAKKFIEDSVVKKIKPQEIIVGCDFSFGKNKQGNIDLLKLLSKKYNFKFKIVKPVKISGKVVSSTLIRKFIQSGDLKKASLFLSRKVSVIGKVIRGKRRGRILGFPTANIDCGPEVVPPRGVYLVKVIIKRKKYFGIANIGFCPSFKDFYPKISTEVHIFNFKGNMYGFIVEIEFLKKIRNEKRFSSKEALTRQIRKDEKKAKSILKYFQL